MSPKNPGPCVIEGCGSQGPFRKFTENAKNNSIIYKTHETYNYLQINDQLCQSHYLLIVEPYRGRDADSTDDIEANFDYWSDIKVKRHEDNVTLSNEDFALLPEAKREKEELVIREGN
ncbi:243_t:CDS:2 [Entrophospora sp. SA101]|nr:243_t:CDS:2 [Entrophospora sp. SA101]